MPIAAACAVLAGGWGAGGCAGAARDASDVSAGGASDASARGGGRDEHAHARPAVAGLALGPALYLRTVEVDGARHPYAVHVPAGEPPRDGWPVVLFLHGSGERGSDGLKQLAVGIYPAVRRDPVRWPAVIVMPQLPTEDPDPWAFFVRWRHRGDLALAALDDAIAAARASGVRVDARRVALTGLSNGGQGAWQLAAEHPGRFTRVMPIAAASIVPLVDERGGPRAMLLNGRPLLDPEPTAEERARWATSLARQEVWAVHGTADPVIPHAHLEAMAAALRAAGARRLTTTYLPGVDHNSWDATYGREDVARWLTGR